MRSSHLLAASLAALAAACAIEPGVTAQSSKAMASAVKQATAGEPEFRALYKELIEINTTLSVGSCTKAAEAMKARLSAAGYPDSDMHLITDPKRPQDGNLIALLPGTNTSLKPMLLPVVSFLGPAAAALLTGSLVVEQVFGLPGVGRYFVQGAVNRDYTLVMGMVIFYAALILLLNLAVDLLYGWLDPRIRHG